MRSRSGQSTVEYAVAIAAMVAALLAMAVYMKRGVSGRLRSAADSISEPYEPRKTTSTFALNQQSDVTTASALVRGNATESDRIQTTTTIHNDSTDRSGTETIGPLGTDLWN